MPDLPIPHKYIYLLLPEENIDEPPLLLVCAKDEEEIWKLVKDWCNNESTYNYLSYSVQIRNKFVCFPDTVSQVIHGVVS